MGMLVETKGVPGISSEDKEDGTSLAVQWLRLHASIPLWGAQV